MALRLSSGVGMSRSTWLRTQASRSSPTKVGGNAFRMLSDQVHNAINVHLRGSGKDAYLLPVLDAPAMHSECKRWVIFSDLHVKGSSISVCEEVLDRVHEAAQQRDAGIIFLGDFWHVRGALSVELLNRVLRCLRKWEQPVIMIPGNHDQVTLGGKVHSLEPLVYAFRPEQILMINEPALCLGALWIPYRRDPAVMKAVLTQAAERADISMVFCHADVKGAYMNDNMRSMEGIDITAFPKHLPIFSGHFHKPHTISKAGSALRYVGSPYQTSLSEAGQDKYFYCVERAPVEASAAPALDGHAGNAVEKPCELRWREVERWVVNIGSKIIKASSCADPGITAAKAGDRVVVTVALGQEYAAQQLRERLREEGIEVELQHEHNPLTRRRAGQAMARLGTTVGAADGSVTSEAAILASQTIGERGAQNGVHGGIPASTAIIAPAPPKLEDMDPLRIFEHYMGQLDISGLAGAAENATAAKVTPSGSQDAIPSDAGAAPSPVAVESSSAAQILHQVVLTEGRATLERLLSASGTEGSRASAERRTRELSLDKVMLSNFGPYGGQKVVEYPLSKRGLVLIRGQSADGTGADSNGAGKTTLAMSVLWGLTGSLDTRMVGDSKSADVTYDAALTNLAGDAPPPAAATLVGKTSKGAGKRKAAASAPAKLVAEVVVTGSINTQPFEIIRRRSARKAELHFTLNGTVLTTQAVKDTQALIDEHLGIQDGLLQRCCFFGQHTHTLQSLLGLTDVKLKQELSALVDTSLWKAARQDVRVRETDAKDRLKELANEARFRREERSRAEAAAAEANTQLNTYQAQYEEALQKAQELPVTSVSIADLVAQLTAQQAAREHHVASTMTHLRDVCNLTKISYDELVAGVDEEINVLRVEIAKVRSTVNATSNARNAVNKKIAALEPQHLNNTRLVQQLLPAFSGKGDNDVDVEQLKVQHEQALAVLTAVNVQMDSTNTSISRLQELSSAHDCSPGSTSSGGNVKKSGASGDACPTCGQELPADTREKRAAELADTLKVLTQEKKTAAERANVSRRQLDGATRLVTAQDAHRSSDARMADLRSELEDHQHTLEVQSAELSALERRLAERQERRQIIESEHSIATRTEQEELAAAEAAVSAMIGAETALQRQIDDLRLKQEEAFRVKTTANAQVAMAQDRVSMAMQQLQARNEAVAALNAALASVEAAEKELTERVVVLERLGLVLGPRGIQNFVFQNIIEQLENITNSYLTVLADGGIQLALQNTGEEEDKIVKSVWVRSRDAGGEYRERALAQLSGGQWRRVSLALDFAFAELIRRRGVLRSNVMVMDEVLTHLDASGREAVGTVLRAMVQGPPPADITASVGDQDDQPGQSATAGSAAEGSGGVDQYGVPLPNAEERRMAELTGTLLGGGAYETVIVILQDLAAAELAEAFDHVDVVVKERDASVVILDGEGV